AGKKYRSAGSGEWTLESRTEPGTRWRARSAPLRCASRLNTASMTARVFGPLTRTIARSPGPGADDTATIVSSGGGAAVFSNDIEPPGSYTGIIRTCPTKENGNDPDRRLRRTGPP